MATEASLQPTQNLRITIAGASGFVGRHLMQAAPVTWKIHALSRGEGPKDINAQTDWRQADLFSLQSSTQALAETDVAIYLVHSMLPSTRLFQGNFADADLLIADNFAKACVRHGVKQIIYLGGLVPEDSSVSQHLASRKEVEDVFKASGIPTTILRAGMVAGIGGSSFEILRNLVVNLPAMTLPRWTQVKTQVVYIDDLIRVIKTAAMNPDFFNQTIDVVNGESLNYEDLIRTTAKALDRRPWLVRVPINSTKFSKRWVSYFGHANFELVSPLIDSLLCELPQHQPSPLIASLIRFHSFAEMLVEILKSAQPIEQRRRVRKSKGNTVRSIQRLPSMPLLDCDDIAHLYEIWLTKILWGLISVHANPEVEIVKFNLKGLPRPLLVLKRIRETELDPFRVKFHIVGGLLVKRTESGWLEFRQIAKRKFTLASINEFIPTLPWYIYRFTQALIHKSVMIGFALQLPTLASQNRAIAPHTA